jgi:GT2 family glycosyltransferase/glycosyltransferase involved in cell wall biosynthesis
MLAEESRGAAVGGPDERGRRASDDELPSWLREAAGSHDLIKFTCNVCSTACECPPERIGREVISCDRCGSTVRFRAVIDAVVRVLTGGDSCPLPNLPFTTLRVLGMSDWYVMADLLAERCRYQNTFYDREPQLDITNPAPELVGAFDLVISSDVLEHVVPPVQRGFEGAISLLRPGGTLILTVPWLLNGDTVEHYPDLHMFDLMDLDGPVLVNRTEAGAIQVFERPVFHGGEGLTLEMRTFSLPDVIARLEHAGFSSIELAPENPEFGVFGCSAIPELGITANMPGKSAVLLARRPAAEMRSATEQDRGVQNALLPAQVERPAVDRWRMASQSAEVARPLAFADDAHGDVHEAVELQRQLTDLRERTAELDRREQRLSDVENALVVKGLRHYRAVLERSLPKGSRRRLAYTRAVRAVRTVAARRWRAPLNLGVSSTPIVSIVIPVHGERETTEQCLRALPYAAGGVAKEVIVVDDASPDDTRAWLSGVVGATVIPLDENVGFLRACNAGVAAARGKYVLLLNNDTIPDAASVDRLAQVLDEDTSIGIVGAKLVNTDGTLQEAGAIIWDDGTGWNVGRGNDAAAPEFNYRRDVDYCSAAALMVRRSLWQEVGGFDERYVPAYYEDTDLCFAARAAGYRVVYEPGASVTHLEGVSHGTDPSSGVKQYQALNRAAFVAKWKQDLDNQYAPRAANVALAKQRVQRGRLFVADATLPTFDRDGGSLRMYRLLDLMRSLGYGVTFLAEDRRLLDPYTQALLNIGVEVVGSSTDLPTLLRALAPDLSAIILSRRGTAWSLIDAVTDTAPKVPLVFDTVDLHFRREEHEGAITGSPEAGRARIGRERELALMRLADQVWVVSGEEKQLVERLVPDASVAVVPNIHDAHPTTRPFDERNGLLFVGGFRHAPNVDAVIWFMDEILPLVRQKLGDVPVRLVGRDAPPEIVKRADDATEVLGWVPDLLPLYDRTRVVIAPLRYGAGMKGKVAEALAFGTPVVTTSVGMDGLAPRVAAYAHVGDHPSGFAQEVALLYEDGDRWERIHRQSPAAVDSVYGGDVVRATLASVFDSIATPLARRSTAVV